MTSGKTFASIADRLGKLIPMLSSDQGGEVVAAAAAIGRTLSAAGFDWHDLGKRLAEPSFIDMMAEAFKPKQPTPPPTPEPTRAPPTASKPKREPSPWPTWGTLSHFGKLSMFEVITAEGRFSPDQAASFAAFHATYYCHQCGATRKTINLFNGACRDLWERGWRPDARTA